MPPGRALPVRHVSRRTALAGGLALAATPWMGRSLAAADPVLGPNPDPDPDGEGTVTDSYGTRAFGFPDPDMTSTVIRPIVFPIVGPVQWTDSYGACRDGCNRRHEGQDLMAAKMQQLVACVDGTVVGLKHASDGNYLFLRDAEGWHYGYLHINNDTPGTDDGANRYEQAFAPGITMGSRVRQGDVIAYVGDSGNAESAGSHCHFEIRRPAAAWYSAQAVNPKPSLDNAGRGPRVDPKAFTPWDTAFAFAAQQYTDILARPPDADGLRWYSLELDRGVRTPASLVLAFLQSAEFEQYIAPVLRLYLGYFERIPDAAGVLHWLAYIRRGGTIGQVSEQFTQSVEFTRVYGGLDDAAYIETVYRNVLRRSADPAGKGFWIDQLRKGTTRGSVMVHFTGSQEFVDRQRTAVSVGMTYIGMTRRTPDATGYLYWIDQIQARGTSPLIMIEQIQFSAEYARRFA